MNDLATSYMARRYAKGGKVSGCYSNGGEIEPLMDEELEGVDLSGDLDEPMDEIKKPIEVKKSSLLSKILGSMLKSRPV